jgi:mono/diheme cytochrome c family protein
MNKRKQFQLVLGCVLLLSGIALVGCNAQPVATPTAQFTAQQLAEVPAEYMGKTMPANSSAERGASLYATHCVSCHGEAGLGDGPAGLALMPPPAPIANSVQKMGDDYLFWRISEGGTPFGTAMPAWKALSEQDRWDVLRYLHTLSKTTNSQ